MRGVRFLAVAQMELDDAVAWYSEQSSTLGDAFLHEFNRAVRRVCAFPMSSPEISPMLRRCLLARFPYGLVYTLEEHTLIIVAVAHLHRKPRYWADRL